MEILSKLLTAIVFQSETEVIKSYVLIVSHLLQLIHTAMATIKILTIILGVMKKSIIIGRIRELG